MNMVFCKYTLTLRVSVCEPARSAQIGSVCSRSLLFCTRRKASRATVRGDDNIFRSGRLSATLTHQLALRWLRKVKSEKESRNFAKRRRHTVGPERRRRAKKRRRRRRRVEKRERIKLKQTDRLFFLLSLSAAFSVSKKIHLYLFFQLVLVASLRFFSIILEISFEEMCIHILCGGLLLCRWRERLCARGYNDRYKRYKT